MKKTAIENFLFLALLVLFIFLSWSKLGPFFSNQGNYYFQKQAYDKAISSYKNSIKINPNSWIAHLGLADTYREIKDYAAATQEYKKVLKLNHLCVRAYDSLSNLYYQNGNYEEALKILIQGQKDNPDDEKIKGIAKGYCSGYFSDSLTKSTELFMAKKNKEAILILENAFRLCSGNALAYYTLAYYYLAEKSYNNAEINLNKSLEIDPQFYYSYKLLSDIYLKRGNIDKAISFAQKEISLNNTDASSYHNLGLLFMFIERYAEAIPYFKKASNIDPDNVNYLYSLASIYRDNKMYVRAIQEYKRLSALKNDYPNMHNDLADIYAVLNNSDLALQEYQQELRNCEIKLKISPLDPVTLNDYAYALNGIGQSQEASQIAEKLVAAYPRYRQAYITLSRIYQKMGKNALAINNLEQAKKIFPGTNFIDQEISSIKNNHLAGKI